MVCPLAPAGAAQTHSQPAPRRPGYIRLELPVFHVGYVKHLVGILQCVCKSCARVMVPEDERRHFLRRLRSPRTEVNVRRALFKKLLDRCKRHKACPHCGEIQGVRCCAGRRVSTRT